MRFRIFWVAGLLPLAVAVPAVAQDCEHEAVRTAALRVPSGARLELEAGAGSLRIEGRPGLGEVRVRGRACAASEELLRELVIESSVSDGVARVRTRHPETRGNWRNQYAYIDLVVEVPAGMAARIEDGSGDAVLTGLGDVDIEDGSGGLQITGVGAVRVEDGSGAITIERAGGDVEIDDGSGEIRIRGVRGSVSLEDGSGDIEVSDVTGTVRVRSDGSGSIDVRGVGGDFLVDADGSGSIRHSEVRGRVRIPD